MTLFQCAKTFHLLAIPLFAPARPLVFTNVLAPLISWLHCPPKHIIDCCQLSALLSILLSELSDEEGIRPRTSSDGLGRSLYGLSRGLMCESWPQSL
jgi:hypothetical protein